jgi:hypothetical protein
LKQVAQKSTKEKIIENKEETISANYFKINPYLGDCSRLGRPEQGGDGHAETNRDQR